MLAEGTTLGRYKILAPLGAGGMGEVYRARDTRLGRDVAIKVIPAELARDPERIKRFEQEARAAGALNHPNICVIYDVGAHEGSPFVVMELLEGESLREELSAGPLAVRKAIDCAAQTAHGLAAAHEKGIVHRDLKPENLFLTRDGRVKILDFGLAKLPRPAGIASSESATVSLAMTETGAILGTAGYMAPEQVRGGPADPRSDLFALGAILYELLTGTRAFVGAGAVETLYLICHEPPPPLSTSGREVPPAIEAIVLRCLEKRQENRFASALDLHSALESVLQTLALRTAAQGPPEMSIAVLPFENLSPDSENAYFADGLMEEIISDLAKVRALRVISRTSAMLLRGSKKDVPTIARELKVRYVLEGSVRRAGPSLRITAQLIDAAADAHLWAEKYTGTSEDVFDMQENVSRAIVNALKLELTPQEHQQMVERPIPNIYAYECYLKARREIWRFVGPSLEKAMEYLEQGLRVLPQAHVVLGLLASWHRGMIKTAIAHFDQVLSADPNDQDALKWSGVFHAFVGKTAKAAAMGERVIAIDPMSPMSYMPLAFSHWLDGRFDLALEDLERAGKVDPGDRIVELTRVFLLIPMGRHEEAFALVDRAGKDEQLSICHRQALLWRYAFVGEREKALSWLSPEAVQTCRRDFQYSWWVACAYVMLGDTDEALDWLENAIELGFLNACYLAEIDRTLAPLREDPRFQALMVRARRMQAELEVRP